MTKLISPRQIVQNAYFVTDVVKAAESMHELLGIGPFFIYQHIKLTEVLYRGKPAELDHSSAYVQAGAVMIELVQQHNEGPSAFYDMYPSPAHGLHHMAIFADDIHHELQRFSGLGFSTATLARTDNGIESSTFPTTRG